MILDQLRRSHDRLTDIGFAGSAAFVGVITVSFWYEVVARYFFSAPTIWAYDIASYSLCPMIFLAMPALTRRGAHITLAYLTDNAPARLRWFLRRLILIAAVVVCLLCAWITGAETHRQIVRDVLTITAFPLPKWWISIFIPYGMFSSAVYFFRTLCGEEASDAPAGETPL